MQVPRTELMNTVSRNQNPSLSVLVCGNDSFSLETNTIIFEKVHKFILVSRRFFIAYPYSIWQAVCICVATVVMVLDAAVAAKSASPVSPIIALFA